MMNLYSGTTCPFSQRCRIVLYEKGMDFQIIDVDMYNKPEDIAAMVALLMSDEGSYITAQVIGVDGGVTMRS